MTKIEQWQEWAKQFNELDKKLSHDNTTIDFCADGNSIVGHGKVKFNVYTHRLTINTDTEHWIELTIEAGKELFSVLKQLYE